MTVRSFRMVRVVVLGCLLMLVAGCAGQRGATGPVFFPPAPNLPRLQYLTGVSTSYEVTGEGKSFSLFSFANEQQKQPIVIRKPAGIAAKGGKIYVSDISGKVVIVDLPKKKMEVLKGKGMGTLSKPVGVAVDNAGFVFVADTERKAVLIFDDKGEYLKSVGGEFDMRPTDVAVDETYLYVLDTRKAVIKVFDTVSGAFVRDIGRLEEHAQSLSLPTKMTLDKKGIIRVTNAGRGDITSYDRDGHFLGSFGRFGDNYGEFSRPKGVASDDNGYVYVVDAGFQNVQIFNDSGRLLTYFGGPTLPAGGLNLPCDIATSSDEVAYFQTLAEKDFQLSEVIFVANQFGDPKITIYGLGKLKGVDYEKSYQRAAEEREQKAREELKQRNSGAQRLSQVSAPRQ